MKAESCADHIASKAPRIFPMIAILFVALSLAALFAGCRSPDVKEPTIQHPSASLGQLLQLMDLKTQRIVDMKAKIKIEAAHVEEKEGEQIPRIREVGGYIAIRRPSSIWLNAHKLTKTILAGQSDGKKFWLALTPERKRFEGSADMHVPRKKESDIAFRPSDIVKVLIVDEFNLPDVHPVFETLSDQYIIYGIRILPGGRPKLYSKTWIERASGEFDTTKHQLFDINGQLRVEADFYEYKEKGGFRAPRWVRIQWPGWKTNIVMDLHSIKINPSELRKKDADKFFRYQIPKSFRKYEVIDIDQ